MVEVKDPKYTYNKINRPVVIGICPHDGTKVQSPLSADEAAKHGVPYKKKGKGENKLGGKSRSRSRSAGKKSRSRSAGKKSRSKSRSKK